VIELGAVPSIWLMTKCYSVLSHPWPLMVALWNEPSPLCPAWAEPASAATPSDATPTASKPAATKERTRTELTPLVLEGSVSRSLRGGLRDQLRPPNQHTRSSPSSMAVSTSALRVAGAKGAG